MAAHRDLRLLLTGRLLRAFGFGFASILLGIHLQSRGLAPGEIGLVLAIGLAVASLAGLVSAAASGKRRRRMVLAATGLLMAICGVALAFATSPLLLVTASLTGMMGVAGTDLGPFLAVEQAVLAQTVPPEQRNRSFARYSLTGAVAGAAGGLAAAGTVLIRTQAFFLLFALLGLATAILPLLLSSDVEGDTEGPVFGSVRPLLGLSALFALDSLGGGLVVNSVLVYWLHIRFGATPAVLGPVFAGMSVLAAISFEISGRIADRIGLVNTMVFTHLPSSLLLLTIPLAPALGWAIVLLLSRAAFQSMDIPARQAYIVSIVKPAERSGALALTGAVRGMAQSFGPAITGAAMQAAALGIPFLLAGSLKSIYDIALFVGYRRRLGDHEVKLGR